MLGLSRVRDGFFNYYPKTRLDLERRHRFFGGSGTGFAFKQQPQTIFLPAISLVFARRGNGAGVSSDRLASADQPAEIYPWHLSFFYFIISGNLFFGAANPRNQELAGSGAIPVSNFRICEIGFNFS